MFSSFFESMRNRRGDSQRPSDQPGIRVSVEVKIMMPPSMAGIDLATPIQQAVIDAVRSALAQKPSSSPSSRSPFGNSPFGDFDIDAILNQAFGAASASRRRSQMPFGPEFESNRRGPQDLNEALRRMQQNGDGFIMMDITDLFGDQAERMGMSDEGSPLATVLRELANLILKDYLANDFSNPVARTAFAALALVREEYKTLEVPQISQEDVEEAMRIIGLFNNGVEHCCGLPFCNDEIVLQVLAANQRLSDEDYARWAEQDNPDDITEPEPVMAEGENEVEEAEQPAQAGGEPEFPYGTQQW